MATATAIIPAVSTKMSTPRSLTATALTVVAPALCASTPAERRQIVITSRAPSTTSSARPTTRPSRCSGPSHRGVATAPRSPASPRMISSIRGSNRTSHCSAQPGRDPPPGVPSWPVVPGGIASRLAAGHGLAFPDVTGGPYPSPPACPGRRYRPGQTIPAAGNRAPWHRRRRTRHHYRGPPTQCHPRLSDRRTPRHPVSRGPTGKTRYLPLPGSCFRIFVGRYPRHSRVFGPE